MKFSVDVHLRLGKQRRQQGVDGLLPKLALFEVEFASEFFGDEPFGEKVDFAQHDVAVVLGQFAQRGWLFATRPVRLWLQAAGLCVPPRLALAAWRSGKWCCPSR